VTSRPLGDERLLLTDDAEEDLTVPDSVQDMQPTMTVRDDSEVESAAHSDTDNEEPFEADFDV
jgi:hypothetical protein